MKRTFVLLALALVACGGKSTPPSTPDGDEPAGGGGRVAAPGTVLGDPAVYEQLKASTIALPAGFDQSMMCEGEAPLGEQVVLWQQQLGGAINATCDAGACKVVLSAGKDPSCDVATDDESCDGGSITIEYKLDAAGQIDVATLMCMAIG